MKGLFFIEYIVWVSWADFAAEYPRLEEVSALCLACWVRL